MKKIITAIFVGIMSISLMACQGQSSEENDNQVKNIENEIKNETIIVNSFNGEVEVPYNPERIAVLDMSLLDTVDALGLEDKVVAIPKSSVPDYLSKYKDNDDITNVGTLKSIDFEALNSAEPDLIIYGTRLDDFHKELSDIAPVIQLKINHSEGYMKTFKENVNSIAKIFEKESEAQEFVNKYDDRIKNLAEQVEGKNALILLVSEGSVSALGTEKRCSIISNEIGFKNITSEVLSDHGDSVSFEFILDKNPDYMFVLDRDAARGVEGASLAKDILENDIIKKTNAYKNGNIVYLTPIVWYIAEGGINSTDIMLSDIENGIINKK